MSIKFRYGMRDGWLECGLTVNDASVVHSVAGWHDGLAELLVAASGMLGRMDEATAYFQEEPGEFRWRLSRLNVNRLRIRVIEFESWGIGRPDKDGKCLFDAPCGTMAFAQAIFDGSSEWLAECDRISNEGGRQMDFPKAEFDQLAETTKPFDRFR